MQDVKNEQKRIQRLLHLGQKKQHADRGGIQLISHKGNIYAYERWQKRGQKGKKKYLGKIDSHSVRELFLVRLNQEREHRLLKNQKFLQNLEKDYLRYDFASIVACLPQAYQKVARKNGFDERYEELRAWASADYPRNPFPFPDSENYAKDGTRMRSKGECLLYNLLQERGILFRYECKLILTDQEGNEKILYPDFLIQCYDGTFIIIEHLGKLGNVKYAMDFGMKCHCYLLGNYILGKNFFVTSDDKNYGTDSHMIAKVVDRAEQLFYGY